MIGLRWKLAAAALGAGVVCAGALVWALLAAGERRAENRQEAREDATRDAIEGAERPDSPGAALRLLCRIPGVERGDLCRD